MTPVEFRGDLWHQKTRIPGLSCGVVCVILRFAVLVEHRLVTDTDTDGHGRTQTDTGPWLVRGCIASRGKNWATMTFQLAPLFLQKSGDKLILSKENFKLGSLVCRNV